MEQLEKHLGSEFVTVEETFHVKNLALELRSITDHSGHGHVHGTIELLLYESGPRIHLSGMEFEVHTHR